MLCGICIVIYALNIVQLALYRIYALPIMMQTILTNRLTQVKVLESRYMTSAAEVKSNTTVTTWIFQWAFKAGCRILFVLFSFRHSSKGQFQIIIILDTCVQLWDHSIYWLSVLIKKCPHLLYFS